MRFSEVIISAAGKPVSLESKSAQVISTSTRLRMHVLSTKNASAE